MWNYKIAFSHTSGSHCQADRRQLTILFLKPDQPRIICNVSRIQWYETTDTSLVRLYADNRNKEYLTNRVYVFNSNKGLGGNWGSKIFVSNGGKQKSNWQTKLSTWLKTTPRAQDPAVCEKTFSTYFVPQPVENTTWQRSVRVSAKAVKFLPAPMDR